MRSIAHGPVDGAPWPAPESLGELGPLGAALAAGEVTVDMGAGADRIMSSFETASARTCGSTGW